MPDYSGLVDSNYGLLTGLSEGLRSAISGFRQGRQDVRDEQQQALQNQMKQKMYALDLEKAGLAEGPDENGQGLFHLAPSFVQKEKAKREAEAAMKNQDIQAETDKGLLLKGLIPQRDANGNVVKFTRVAGFQDPEQQNKLLEIQLKQQELAKHSRELNDPFNQAPKLQQEEAKRLTAEISKTGDSYDQLRKLKEQYDATTDPGQKYALGQEALQQLPIGAHVPRGLIDRLGAQLDVLPTHRPGWAIGRQYDAFGKQLQDVIDRVGASRGDIDKKIQGLIPGYKGSAMSGASGPAIDQDAVEAEIKRRGLAK